MRSANEPRKFLPIIAQKGFRLIRDTREWGPIARDPVTQNYRNDSLNILSGVVVTQVPLHGIRLSQRELHQMNVPDVKAETQNASIRNDEGSASLVKSIKAHIASNWL